MVRSKDMRALIFFLKLKNVQNEFGQLQVGGVHVVGKDCHER